MKYNVSIKTINLFADSEEIGSLCVRGKRSVNTKFALLCEKALNIPAYLLLRLQADYDMLVTKRDKSFAERLAKVRKIAAVL